MIISVCVGSIRGGTVGALIESIIRQSHRDWELLVVAQGDDERLLDEVARRAMRDSRVRLVRLQQFGRSRALNAAMRVAQGDVFAFTDDDCEAAPDWLANLASCFRREPGVGIVGGDLLTDGSRGFSISTCPTAHTIDCIYRPSEHGFRAPSGFYWIGGNVALRREAAQRIGPFDDHLGVGTEFPSCEDVDYALRAEEADVVTWTTPRVRVHHTYGRRHGIKNFLAHHRGYALGQGALGAKLQLWNHRLATEWAGTPSRAQLLRSAFRRPRALLELTNQRYTEEGRRQCLAKYELNAERLLQPRQQVHTLQPR